MMLYLQLFYEFFLTGLFSVGGGLATIPFLKDMGERTGWFDAEQLTNMIAVSESTPGPLGVNMAAYVGYETGGILGGIIATLGLITPGIIVILIVAAFLNKYRNNKIVEAIFYGLRPASTGLIAAAGWTVVTLSLVSIQGWNHIEFYWPCLAIAAVVFIVTHVKILKNLHPVVWIILSAAAGIVLEL